MNISYFSIRELKFGFMVFKRLLYLSSFFTVTLFSCNNLGSDINNDVNRNSKCPPDNTTILPRPNIQTVNVFLDVSGSMKGFMPSTQTSTDFQKLIPDLLVRVKDEAKGFNFYTLAQKTKPINEIAIDKVRTLISKGDFPFGNSSTLPVMFDTVVSYVNNKNLSILITDAIYSPPSGSLKLRDQAITDVRERILKASAKGFAVSGFSLKSEFNKIASPYYLFVIGAPQNIMAFKDQLISSLDALNANIKNKGFKEVDFGFQEINPFYSIIPYVGNTGAAEAVECPDRDNRYLAMENVVVKSGPEFWVGFNVSGGPAYIEQTDYLTKNLELSNNGLQAIRIHEILSKSQFVSMAEDQTDKKLINKCTHFIRIKIFEMLEKTGEIRLSLKKNRPDWIGDYSHSIIDSAEKKRDKTFGLDNIVAGIEDAYKNKETGYFFKDLKILVTKN